MRFPFLAFVLLLLGACTFVGGDRALRDPMENPLYASTLADEQLDFLVAMTVDGISDPAVRRAHERALAETQRLKVWAQEQQDAGETGSFVSDNYFVEGSVLVLADTLHLGPDFVAEAAPGLRIALSTVLVPKTYDDFVAGEYRDVGPLGSFIGEQSYRLDPPVKENEYATVVLYAPELKVVLGFAQI